MKAFFAVLFSKLGVDLIRKLVSVILEYIQAQIELAHAKKELKRKLKEIQNEKLPDSLSAREKAVLRAKRINDLVSTI